MAATKQANYLTANHKISGKNALILCTQWDLQAPFRALIAEEFEYRFENGMELKNWLYENAQIGGYVNLTVRDLEDCDDDEEAYFFHWAKLPETVYKHPTSTLVKFRRMKRNCNLANIALIGVVEL